MTTERYGACGVISTVLTVLNGLGLVAFAVAMLIVRPRFAQMYDDFGAALPPVTVALLSITGGAVMLGFVLLLAILIGKEWLRPKTLPLTLNCIWMLVGIVVWVLVSLALMAPMGIEQI